MPADKTALERLAEQRPQIKPHRGAASVEGVALLADAILELRERVERAASGAVLDRTLDRMEDVEQRVEAIEERYETHCKADRLALEATLRRLSALEAKIDCHEKVIRPLTVTEDGWVKDDTRFPKATINEKGGEATGPRREGAERGHDATSGAVAQEAQAAVPETPRYIAIGVGGWNGFDDEEEAVLWAEGEADSMAALDYLPAESKVRVPVIDVAGIVWVSSAPAGAPEELEADFDPDPTVASVTHATHSDSALDEPAAPYFTPTGTPSDSVPEPSGEDDAATLERMARSYNDRWHDPLTGIAARILARLRQQEGGERIEGWVDRDALVWFREDRSAVADGRLFNVLVYKYRQHHRDVRLILHPSSEGEGE